jgi:hypothetical protein
MMKIRAPRKILVVVAAVALSGIAAAADAPGADAPAPTQHQLMKDCMAKQKAANSGLPKEDMKSACKDVTKTEKQNDDAAKKQADNPQPPAP